MKFTRLFRSAAAIVLSATLCGCSIKFGTNIKPDNNHYVAKPTDSTLVDELGITYAEFMNDYTYYLNLLEITDDTQDSVSDICKSYRAEIIKTLILEKICTVKAEEYGVSDLTEDEEKQAREAAESIINQRINYYAVNADYGSVDPSTLTDEEKQKRGGEELDKELASYGLTRDDYYTKQRRYMLSYKLMQAVGEEIDRSEAEKIFDDYAKVAKETYESSISDYEQSGISQYYIPEGSRYIKHILISFSDDDVTALQTMRLTGDDEGADNLRAEKAEALDEKVNEVIGKLDAGENWDAVSNAYSADASASASYPDGYLVIPNGTTYMKEFQEAAFVPEKIGDRTVCVTDYGVHIMIYAADAKVKDSDRQSIVNNIYNSLVKQEFVDKTTEWIEEYGFYDNMDYELLGIDPPEDEQTSQ